MLPSPVFDTKEYAALRPGEVKLLLDLLMQFNGANNGDLVATWDTMSRRGWRSQRQMQERLHGLLRQGWVVVTRAGGRNLPSLYALTWLAIDACDGKEDPSFAESVRSRRPLDWWRTERGGWWRCGKHRCWRWHGRQQ